MIFFELIENKIQPKFNEFKLKNVNNVLRIFIFTISRFNLNIYNASLFTLNVLSLKLSIVYKIPIIKY